MTKQPYLYDIHNHTSPYSGCSHMSFKDVCTHISDRLNGFAITDHNYIPPAHDVKIKRRVIWEKLDMVLFYGVELTTPDGHLLAYGIRELPPAKLTTRKTIKMVHDLGGVVIAAHPWRNPGFPEGGIGDKVYEYEIDALELCNGSTNRGTNRMTHAVAKELNLPTTGGSDAHRITGMNKAATAVPKPLSNVSDFVKAIQNKQTKGIFL